MLTFVRRGWFLSLRCSFFGIFKQKTKYHDLHALRCYFQIQQFQKPSFQLLVCYHVSCHSLAVNTTFKHPLRLFTSESLSHRQNTSKDETFREKKNDKSSTNSSSSSLTNEEKFINEAYKNLSLAREVDPSEIARITNSLNDICDVKMLENEAPDKIIELWKQFHMKKYCVFSSIPSQTYTSLNVRLQRNPMFILPLPREQKVEFVFMQVQDDIVLFTSLQEYKEKGINSQPLLVIKHYTELKDSKQLVLMRGEIFPQKVTLLEAQLLVNQLQMHYLDDKRYQNVERFNKYPQHFDYNSLLEHIPIPQKEDNTASKTADMKSANTNKPK
jgi:ATP synthase F1 complex assembly factor 1